MDNLTSTLTPDEQFQCLNLLDFLSDLFTSAGKEHFTRENILLILNSIKHDPEMFDPQVVVAQELATENLDEER